MSSKPNTNCNAEKEYNKRIEYYSTKLKRLSSLNSLISNLRLGVFLGGVGGSIYLYFYYRHYSGYVLWTAILIFICLMVVHEKYTKEQKYITHLYEINSDSLKRLNGEWRSFDDKGGEYLDKKHPFTGDLDIFGEGSLFQLINATNTYIGRSKLYHVLAGFPRDSDTILRSQECVKELAGMIDFRQELQAEGRTQHEKLIDPEYLISWAKQTNKLYLNKGLIIGARLLPVITLILGALHYILGVIPLYLPLISMLLQMLALALRFKEINSSLSTADKYQEDIRIYAGMLEILEKQAFKSHYINEIKTGFMDGKKHNASRQIKELAKIVDYITIRRSQIYLAINILLLWDYQCQIMLERWKEKSGSHIKTWLDAIGELEVLASLAGLQYDHPDWAMPKVIKDRPMLNAKDMGHPLLLEGRVNNDLVLGQEGSILLITGSNMSGKSTLLRTAGINLVLAYSGAPVCASEFSCSMMDIFTSMRISDSLEENTSSFYAELLRIKSIIESAGNGRSIFFLLDEIFRGTNSIDRHTGAKVLVNKLRKLGAAGLISTHDLELGSMEKESGGRIKNYHFQEQFKDGQIRFDYKLRRGISTTRNAMYLMKMVGITDDEQGL